MPRDLKRSLTGAALGIAFFVQSFTGSTAFGALLAQTSQPTPSATSSSSAQAPRSRNATFGIQPASATKTDSRAYFSIAATPGARLTDHFAVRNYSLRPLTLSLKAADAFNTPEGDFAVLPPNQTSSEVGTWITLVARRKTIVVPARGTVIIPFNVAIPPNAQPGDHAGGITVTLESVARSATGQTYKLRHSVGSRVFIRVSGPLDPRLSVEDLSVRYDGTVWPFQRQTAVVSYTVRNTGNVALGGRPNVSISGLLRLRSSAPKLPQIGVLLPGFAVKKRVEIRGVIPQIWMTADVSIAPLVLPGSVQDIKGPFTGSSHFWAVPWVLIGFILFLIAGVGYVRRRRRRPPRIDTSKGPVAPARAVKAETAMDQLQADRQRSEQLVREAKAEAQSRRL